MNNKITAPPQVPLASEQVIAFSLSPNVADAVNAGMLQGLEAVQSGSPAIVAAGIVVGAAMAWRDRKRTHGMVNKMAWRSATSPLRSVRGGPFRKAAAYAALTSAAALPIGATAFTFGLENAVRTGQLGVVDELTQNIGLEDSTLLITQGGVDTPMDTSFVPKEVADQVGGAGFYVLLPNVKEKNGERVDGLLFTNPLLESGTVSATGLTGIGENEEVLINGSTQKVDKILDRDVAAMRREVLITSNDVAEDIMHINDESGNYFGIVLPNEQQDKDSVQNDLDQKYGENTYSVMTMQEFKDGVETFMSNNGTAVLLLASIIAAAGGTVAEVGMVKREIDRKKKTIATLKAQGGSNYTAAAPEIQSAAYKLVGAVPLAVLTAKIAETGANAANLGLGMNVGSRELLAGLVVVGLPSLGVGSLAARKITKSTAPVQAMRDSE
jgi:hypothetical protein